MHGTRLRAALVVVEVSVAIIVLSAAVLLTRSARNMVNGDPGVRLDHVLTMQLSMPRGTSDSSARDFVSRLDASLRTAPGVLAAGVTSTTPLSNNWWGTVFSVPGRPPQANGSPLTANDQRITADYVRAMGIRILSGRGITAGDRADTTAQRVAVINHYMASHVWPDASPLGQTIIIDSVPWTIVGVVSDVHHGGLDESLRNEIYRPAAQAPSTAMDLEVWTAGDPRAMREPVRLAVASVDPRVAVGDVMTMRELEARHISPFRLIADVVNTFAIIVVLIAVVGLYGVIAYGVAQRRRELAVRMALGASRGDIVSYVAGG
ncbi:MAG TPA: ABC transporter permease, partial [Gemmatimonadaceae bacterium]|nr:ABC transporter permease [Gemmatimonadaceae bacterium]